MLAESSTSHAADAADAPIEGVEEQLLPQRVDGRGARVVRAIHVFSTSAKIVFLRSGEVLQALGVHVVERRSCLEDAQHGHPGRTQ